MDLKKATYTVMPNCQPMKNDQLLYPYQTFPNPQYFGYVKSPKMQPDNKV